MKTTLKLFLASFFLFVLCQSSFAQNDEVYEKYKSGIVDQLLTLKYHYFKANLKLSEREETAFWEVYEKINSNEAQQKNEAIKMREVSADDKMLMKFKIQINRAETEMQNYNLLKSVLSEANLLKYYEVEKEFQKEIQTLLR